MRRLLFLFPVLACLFGMAARAEGADPQRIVSTNLCADQLALLLAPERLVSVTSRARDPDVSNVVALAEGLPLNDGRVEEVMALKPDFVLTDQFWNARASQFMARLGVRVHGLGWAESLADVRAVIRDAGQVLGAVAQAEAMIADMDARLQALSRENRVPVRTLLYSPNGFSAGPQSVAHTLLGMAGLVNVTAEAGGDGFSAVSIESAVLLKPDLIVIDSHRAAGESRAEAMMAHPAFLKLDPQPMRVWLPSRLWLCPGPWIAEAAERLVQAGDAFRQQSPTH